MKTEDTDASNEPLTGKINGHKYVDLGLSVKWAACNVGASSPSDYGDYYAWGETQTKSEYREENSRTYGKVVGDIAGDPSYDAARANWGGTWRMPTKEETDELAGKCKWTWTERGGYWGYKVRGPSGGSIFLPAAGYRVGTSLRDTDEIGYYWSATPNEGDTGRACLIFNDGSFDRGDWGLRQDGLSVRPVSE